MHRPGTSETFAEVVPAPADLGNALIGVPEGTDIDMNVRLESVVDGILVTGDAVVDVHGECSLCLDPIDYEMSADIHELCRSSPYAGKHARVCAPSAERAWRRTQGIITRR